MGFLKQNALPQAVKGRYFQPLRCFFVHETGNPLPHFPCRLVSKGNGTYLMGCVTLLDQPGYLTGDYTGLAAPGTRQHETGPIDAFDRLLLRLIEILQVQGG